MYVKIHRKEHNKNPFCCRLIKKLKHILKAFLLMLRCYLSCTPLLWSSYPMVGLLNNSFGVPLYYVRNYFGESW